MKTISKLHDKCNECKYKDKCNEKRMVACAIAELPQSNIENMVMPSTEPYSTPIARKETTITINTGENSTMNTSLEEITKKIEEDFCKRLNCSFMRW